MNWATIWSIALGEARLTRRLVRYWIFLGLAFLVATVGYLYYFALHYNFSAVSGTAASINPRYLVGAFGNYYVLIFALGAIFLGCEVRAREERERIAEALDARPMSNLELMSGKFLGLLLIAWIPAVATAVFFGVLGWVIGAAVQPFSLFGLAVFMALPAFAFCIGLTFFVSLMVRLRWVAVIALVGLLVGLFWLTLRLPIYASAAADVPGGFMMLYPSDLVPGVSDGAGWLQRIAVLVVGVAFLFLAAAVHPRRDDSGRAARAAAGLCLLLIGGIAGGAVVKIRERPLGRMAAWRAAHALRKTEPAPAVASIVGTVGLDPGRALSGDVTLTFRAPAGKTLSRALFTLNPGLKVESVTDPNAGAVGFTFADGLLDLALTPSLGGDATRTVRVKYTGRPDSDFAYFDAGRQPLGLAGRDAQIFLLGSDGLVFDRRAVDLLPGVRWLPASGAEVGRDDPRTRPPEFFTLDLTVEAPEKWLVAGPARRQAATGAPAGRTRFRFVPPAPVPEVALVAGRFESRSAEIGGVRFEVLVHSSHAKCFVPFDDAGAEIRQWLGQKLKDAADGGLAYPYDSLSLVEVPNTLRGYGGGWRMDTTLAPPAMLLMRESGFPTARFDVAFKNPDRFKDKEGGLPRAKREQVEKFFDNDFSGGNPFPGVARNFQEYQTGAVGTDAVALNYLVEDLAAQWLTGKRGYFSAYAFDRKVGNLIGQAIGSYFSETAGGSGGSFSDAVVRAIVGRPAIWDAALGAALVRLDPWSDPQKVLDVLTLRGGGMARSVLDGLGKEKTGRLLGALRAQRRGASFTRADLIAAGQSVGEDLTATLRDGLESTALPGFVATRVRATRLADSRDGTPRYQLLLTLQNDEAAPGILMLKHRVTLDDKGGRKEETVGPFRIAGKAAVEIGVVTSHPFERLMVAPYLSLNRDPFTVSLPPVDPKKIEAGEPFTGLRDVAWSPPVADEVVVDDLDPGFRTVESENRGWFRLGGQSAVEETDNGLPALPFMLQPPSTWSRVPMAGAYGKYRHTVAVVAAGSGSRTALFRAQTPRSGQYTLDFYTSGRARSSSPFGRKQGTWAIKVAAAGVNRTVDFNADAAEEGWNNLGLFDLPAGEVRVELSDKTSGAYVAADAVRWRPATAK